MTEAAPSAQQQIERDFRWNFLVNSLDGAFFWCGMSFFSSTIILPLFVRHFTDNPLAIGLIPFIGWAGVLLPQMSLTDWSAAGDLALTYGRYRQTDRAQALHAALGEAAFAKAWAEGLAMSIDEAVAEALTGVPKVPKNL